MKATQIENKNGTLTFDPSLVVRAMAIENLTLDQLAARIGGRCTRQAIWRITNAKSTRPAYLHEVCKLLGVNVEDCYPLPENVK